MAKAKKAPKKWITATVASLCFQPGEHINPEIPGFGLRVSPKLKAVYFYRFRDKTGHLLTDTIGEAAEKHVGGIALADAQATFEHKRALAKGEEIEGILTLRLAFDKYMLQPKRGGDGPKAETTLEAYRSLYSRRLKKAANWGLVDTKHGKWEGLLDGIRAESVADARIAFMLIKAIYADYVERGDIPRNPVAIRAFRDTYAGKDSRVKRKTYIALHDLRTFFTNLRNAPTRGFGNQAVRTLALTGWRLNGVLQLKFTDVDFDTSVLTVKPRSEGWKEYEGPIAISPPALALMAAQKTTTKPRSNKKYIYPGNSNGKSGHMRNIYGTMAAASEGLGWLVKPHDLRRTYATVANIVLHGNDRMVGLLIGHQQPQSERRVNPTTGDYIMSQLAAEVHAANKVSEAILMLAGEMPISAELIARFKEEGLSFDKLELKDTDE